MSNSSSTAKLWNIPPSRAANIVTLHIATRTSNRRSDDIFSDGISSSSAVGPRGMISSPGLPAGLIGTAAAFCSSCRVSFCPWTTLPLMDIMMEPGRIPARCPGEDGSLNGMTRPSSEILMLKTGRKSSGTRGLIRDKSPTMLYLSK
jgi:hypothetical protein